MLLRCRLTLRGGFEADHDSMRLNDGAVDSRGRIFVGACNDPDICSPAHEGVLLRLDPDLSLHCMLDGLDLPNGLAWNTTEDTIYLTETLARTIRAFTYSKTDGSLSHPRTFFRLDSATEAPDGLTIDCEDHLWSTIYGGGKVLRISPLGEVVGIVRSPTRCVTSTVFIGRDLFITSAADPYPGASHRSIALGGSVFRVSVGIQGIEKNRWRRM